jgi:hypothetical protein
MIDPARLAPIRDAALPHDAASLHSFLGFAQWFAPFVPGLAALAAPLWSLLKKDAEVAWTPAATQACAKIRDAILNAEPLAQYTPGTPLTLRTDASILGIGGVLLQLANGMDRPLAFYSRKLTSAEQKYSTLELEALAILYCLDRARPLLHGPVVVVTDHSNLQFLHASQNRRIQRWALTLADYDITIVYKPGVMNVVANYLSCAFHPDTAIPVHAVVAEPLPLCPRDPALAAALGLDPASAVNAPTTLEKPPAAPVVASLWALAHEDIMAGHVGAKRTLATIRQVVDWPGLAKEVKDRCASCPLCQKLRSRAHRAPITGNTAAARPFESIFIDYLGPLRAAGDPPCTYILVFVDRFSHFVLATATPDVNYAAAANILFKDWVCRFGAPLLITTDGPFKAAAFATMAADLQARHHVSAPLHPEGHGPVERANYSLMQVLRALFRAQPDWPRMVPPAAFALNTTVSRLLGTSPFAVVHGFNPRLPIHQAAGIDPNPDAETDPFSLATALIPATTEIFRRVARLHAEAFAKEAEATKDAPGKTKYAPGDYVLLFFPRPEKLLLAWRGPYQVVAIVPDTANLVYELADLANVGNKTTAHVNRMLPFRTGLLSADQIRAEACAQELYLIAAVRRHEHRGPELWFLVDWLGYPALPDDDPEAWVNYPDCRFAPAVRDYIDAHHIKVPRLYHRHK